MRSPALQTCLRASASRAKTTPAQWMFFRSASSSSLDHLHGELTARKLNIIYDHPNETNSRLLDVTLSDFLPDSTVSTDNTQTKASWRKGDLPQLRMRPGHHLVYFPPASKLSLLLPDGTDPDQSPGEPFVRRMWAGGRIKFPRGGEMPPLDGSLQACTERIVDVVLKGNPGDEKIFVTIERCFSSSQKPITEEAEDKLRGQAATPLTEYRDIVFMKEKPVVKSDAPKKPGKVVKAPHQPTASHTLLPTENLLFRFSALTFNAHRIHLDMAYCRDVEGHRGLLVHGPLSLTLMLELVNRHLKAQGGQKEISEISYRNVAPLYHNEKMTVCLRDREDGDFDVWVENSDGGLSVKGTIKTQ